MYKLRTALVAAALSLTLLSSCKPAPSLVADRATGPIPQITGKSVAVTSKKISKKPGKKLGTARPKATPPPTTPLHPTVLLNVVHYTNVLAAFTARGLIQWWNNPTQVWGQNGEKGTDYGMGGTGKPVGAIAPGTVVYVGNGGYPGSSIGEVIQILAPDGSLTHYQHMMTSSVVVGQKVYVGEVVGLGGGCPVGAYSSDGEHCTWYDKWSTGQHIEVRYSPTYVPALGVWSQAWIDPRPVFYRMAHS